ncbi:hypothetical protein [Halomonas salipaludis]|uniref:hypothetical protein n=1 Tax=Halomonas salipaludis TaxID=2032625 RepID=UPI001E56754F|nr:hypothetical protein [Halomonas salipaludis]
MSQALPIKTIHGHHCHHGWDNSIAAVEQVAPGITLTVVCHDAAGGHFNRDSGIEAVASMPFERINPVTRHLDGAGYEVFTGIGPDLMSGAR